MRIKIFIILACLFLLPNISSAQPCQSESCGNNTNNQPLPVPTCGVSCGDGVCSSSLNENMTTCPQDCGTPARCGDGVCSFALGENGNNCPQDCQNTTSTPTPTPTATHTPTPTPTATPSHCGDGVCSSTLGENTTTCPQDCGRDITCGDGVCSNGENYFNCQYNVNGHIVSDCMNMCGDGVCQRDMGETNNNCAGDCHVNVTTTTIKPTTTTVRATTTTTAVTTTTTTIKTCAANQLKFEDDCYEKPACKTYNKYAAADYFCIRNKTNAHCRVNAGLIPVWGIGNDQNFLNKDLLVWCSRPGANGGNIVPIYPKANVICACIRLAGCFHPETKITLADGHVKMAKEITAADQLLNPVTGRAMSIKAVIESSEEFPLVEFGYQGVSVRVSQKHPVLIQNGKVKKAIDLALGDKILGADGAYHQIDTLVQLPVEDGQRVINFNLEVASDEANDHLILSDGIVTGDLQLQSDINE